MTYLKTVPLKMNFKETIGEADLFETENGIVAHCRLTDGTVMDALLGDLKNGF
jgi:hypothetical protein